MANNWKFCLWSASCIELSNLNRIQSQWHPNKRWMQGFHHIVNLAYESIVTGSHIYLPKDSVNMFCHRNRWIMEKMVEALDDWQWRIWGHTSTFYLEQLYKCPNQNYIIYRFPKRCLFSCKNYISLNLLESFDGLNQITIWSVSKLTALEFNLHQMLK